MALEMKDFDNMNDLMNKTIKVIHVDGDSICEELIGIGPLMSGDFVVKSGDKDFHHLTGRWFYFGNGMGEAFVWQGSTIEVNGEPWPKKEAP